MEPAPEAPSGRGMAMAFSLVGVLMFLGFGAGVLSRVRDAMTAPAEPPRVEGAHLIATARAGATWLAVSDAAEPCAYPAIPSGSSSATYRVIATVSGGVVALSEASDARACSDAPRTLTGTVRFRALDDLQLPPDATRFVRESIGDDVLVLWVDDSPHLGAEDLLLVVMAGLGLVIAWFYAASARVRSAAVRLGPRDARPSPPLLPRRPLALAPDYRASPMMGVAFFGLTALMFGAMTVGEWPAGGFAALDLATGAILLFCGGMTLVLVALLAVVLRNTLRAQAPLVSPEEAWAPVVDHRAALARGVDVGNRTLCYEDPFETSSPPRVVALSIGANEALAWIVEGHVHVARFDGSPVQYVLRVDGGPFVLDEGDIARITRA